MSGMERHDEQPALAIRRDASRWEVRSEQWEVWLH